MTLTDEQVVAHLTEQADRALPAMSLDAGTVLTAGRRFRRRRRAARAAGVCAVLVLVAVAPQLLPEDEAATTPAASPTEPPSSAHPAVRVWRPAEAHEVTTDLGPALELAGSGLPGADSIVLLPTDVDESTEPHVLNVELRYRTDGVLEEPLTVVPWPLRTDGVPSAEVDEAFDLVSDGAIDGDLVTVVGTVPPGQDAPVLRVLDTRVEIEPYTTDLLPGRAVYVAVVDMSELDELPQISISYTASGSGITTGGWVLLP